MPPASSTPPPENPREDPSRPVPEAEGEEFDLASPGAGNTLAGEEAGKTGEEEIFYREQMEERTPLVVVTTGGTRITGWLEWYDRQVIKMHSLTEPNRLVRKDEIKYIYRHADDPGATTPIPTPPPLGVLGRKRRGRRDSF
jgi:hypothetical protein